MASVLQLNAIHARMTAGDIVGATTDIEAVLNAEPYDPDVLHLAGVVRRRAGNLRGAIQALEAAIKYGTPTAEIYNSLGLSYQETKQHESGIRSFEEAIKLDPDYEPVQINYARQLSMLGRCGEAEDLLREWLKDHPPSDAVKNTLAAVLRESGKSVQAIDQYQEVLAHNPGNLVAAIRVGEVLREIDRTGAAVRHYESLQSRHGQAPEFQEAHAGALISSGQVQAALNMFEQVVQSTPGYFPAHRAIARISREYGIGDDPYRSFRQLTKTWPNEPAIWTEWASLLISYRDYSMVTDLLWNAERNCGRVPAIRLSAAIAAGELGQHQRCETLLDELEPHFSDNQAYRIARLRNSFRIGDAHRAEKIGWELVSADRNSQFGWAYLSLAWRMLGDEREFWLHDYSTQVSQRPIDYLDGEALEELREYLRSIHCAQANPPDQTLRNGTQTEGSLFHRDHPIIRRLQRSIEQQIYEYVARLPDDAAHPFYSRKREQVRFTGSWSVRLTTNGFHVAHLHENGWVSSALHLVQPDEPAAGTKEAGHLVLGSSPSGLGLDFAPRRTIVPQIGSLVLFPSSMWHGTLPFASGAERLTVAFDVVPV